MAEFENTLWDGTAMATPVVDRGSDAGSTRDATHRSDDSRRPDSSWEAGVKRAIVVSAGAVKEERVSWLWKGRVPFGAVTSLEGLPGLGKSTLTVEIAARLSRGETMPFDDTAPQSPSDSLLLCDEDSYAATIRPRLAAAQADLSRVHFLEGIGDGSGQRPPSLPDDLDQIESVIFDHGVRFVAIDPISSFLGKGFDITNEKATRDLLTLLTRLADRTGAAVMPIRHFRKQRGPAIHRGVGSNAFSAVVRSILTVGRDPRDKDARILGSVKSNLGATPPSVSFKLEPVGDVARIAWQGEIELGPDDLTAGANSRTADGGPELNRAKEFLMDRLNAGPVEFKEIKAMWRAELFSEKTIRRAKLELGVKSGRRRFGPKDIEDYWMLPDIDNWARPSVLALPAEASADPSAAGPQP